VTSEKYKRQDIAHDSAKEKNCRQKGCIHKIFPYDLHIYALAYVVGFFHQLLYDQAGS